MHTHKMAIFSSLASRIFTRKLIVENVRFYSESGSSYFYKIPSKIKSSESELPWPIYGGRHLVTMLPGSGIGPEMTSYVKEVFETAQVPVDFETIDYASGADLVEKAITSIRRNRIAIKGNLQNVIDEDLGFIAPNVFIRTKLDLFVYVIHYKSYHNVKAKIPDLDLVMIRQNTEGEYSMLEHETVKGVVESMKIVTRENVKRLAEFAFGHAQKHHRNKITVVHKSRQLSLSDGLFLDTIQQVGADHPQISLDDIYIDRCCQELVRNPKQFDVLLMPNLYGNIASNIVCGLAGGNGLFCGINYGSHDFAIFETATRQTGANLIGQNIANPVAMLNASVNMLRHLGLVEHAQVISDAVHTTLSEDGVRTLDIGGVNSTREVVDHIKEYISLNLSRCRSRF